MMQSTTRFIGWILVLVLFVMTGDALPQRRERPDRGTNGCYTVRVSSPEASPENKKGKSGKRPVFSATEILDLAFDVLLPASLTGEHRLELEVRTPKGHLYQTLDVRVAPAKDADAPETSRRYRSRRRFRSVRATLPVAGTTIVTSSLYGVWEVEAHLDGSRKPCARATEFEIEP